MDSGWNIVRGRCSPRPHWGVANRYPAPRCALISTVTSVTHVRRLVAAVLAVIHAVAGPREGDAMSIARKQASYLGDQAFDFIRKKVLP